MKDLCARNGKLKYVNKNSDAILTLRRYLLFFTVR